jgi:hypothetical protein
VRGRRKECAVAAERSLLYFVPSRAGTLQWSQLKIPPRPLDCHTIMSPSASPAPPPLPQVSSTCSMLSRFQRQTRPTDSCLAT